MVMVMVLVDLVILVVYTVVEGVMGGLEAERLENEENPMDVKGVSAELLTLYPSKLLANSLKW